jgi:hypothetical protein
VPLISNPVPACGTPFPGRPDCIVSPSGKVSWTIPRWAGVRQLDPKTVRSRLLKGSIAGEWLSEASGRRPRFFVTEEPVEARGPLDRDSKDDGPAGGEAVRSLWSPAEPQARGGLGDRTGSGEGPAPGPEPPTADARGPDAESLQKEIRQLKNALRGAHMTIDHLKQALTGLQEGQRDLYTPDWPGEG